MKQLLIAIFIVSFVAWPVSPTTPSWNGELQIGGPLPDFLGKGVDGKRVELADYSGKIVVITFWATWCPPCMKELPILDNIQRQVTSDRLQVIAINYGQDRKTFRKIKKWLKNAALKLTHDKRKVVAKRYGVDAIPAMFIVDKEGKLAFTHLGYSEDEILKVGDELNALLKTL